MAAGNYARQTVEKYDNMTELTIIIWFRIHQFPAALMSNGDGNVNIRIAADGNIDFHLGRENER